MYDLTRKIALVTGIGGPVDALGNGKAIAMLLAKQGAIIEGTDIDVPAGANTVAAIRDAGGTAYCSYVCLLYTSPSPRDLSTSRMPSSA